MSNYHTDEYRELNEAFAEQMGQRNEQWAKERIGRFTSSQFSDLIAKGKGGTKTKRDKAKKDLEKGSIDKRVYNELIEEFDLADYEARFGAGCRTYVYSKIAELLTQTPHFSGGGQATAWGEDHEQPAVDAYMKKTGKKVIPMGFITFEDYAGGSPDGKIPEDNGIIEIKSPFNPGIHIKYVLTEVIPDDYYWQIHGNILATGADYCDFISYDPRMPEGLQLYVQRVERDETVIAELKARIDEVRQLMVDIIASNAITKKALL